MDQPERSASDVVVDLTGRAETTKSLRLQGALRDAIRSGQLAVGDRLPPTRVFADDLALARNVVVDAYDQLIAEGYLAARRGSGTWVVGTPPRHGVVDAAAPHATAGNARRATEASTLRAHEPGLDLSPGLPDLHAFPLGDWRRCVSDALSSLPAAELGYADGRGAAALRDELARYARRVRGADIDPQRLVVTTGVSAAIGLLARTLAARGVTRVAVEEPGAYSQWGAITAAGADLVPIQVDDEGLDVDALERSDVSVVVVSPAHQYPLGWVMSPRRRDALIAWARRQPGRIVIEDDYDAEFRFDRQPVGTLQGLAPDVVALTNSISKTIAPGLRLGWLAAPAQIADEVIERITAEFVTPDTVSQHALALLLSTGRYDRIIRSRRRTYQQRRTTLVTALGTVPGCSISGAAGGLHLTVLLPAGVDDVDVSTQLGQRGIRVPPLAHYRRADGPPGLVASFSNLGVGHATQFATELAAVIARNEPPDPGG